MNDSGGREGRVRFRGAVKYPGDDRHLRVYLSSPLACLSIDSVGLGLSPSLRLLGVLLPERRWPWSAILAVQAAQRGVKIVTRDFDEEDPIVFLVDPLPGLIRTTPRLLDTLEQFNAPLDRRIHKTGWFSLRPIGRWSGTWRMRLMVWMGWILAVPLAIIAWLTVFHPNLLPVFIGAGVATALAISALFVWARQRQS